MMGTDVVKPITRDAILAAKDFVTSLPNQIHPEAVHHFVSGVYCREITIPADIVLMGKIHKHETLNVLLKGIIEIAMEGVGVQVMEAPLIFTSPAGTQKVIRTITETTFLNFHATPDTDLEKIESQMIAQSFEEYDQYRIEQDRKKIEGVA